MFRCRSSRRQRRLARHRRRRRRRRCDAFPREARPSAEARDQDPSAAALRLHPEHAAQRLLQPAGDRVGQRGAGRLQGDQHRRLRPDVGQDEVQPQRGDELREGGLSRSIMYDSIVLFDALKMWMHSKTEISSFPLIIDTLYDVCIGCDVERDSFKPA